jgi:DNA polymerase-3 subunit delta
MACVLVGQAAGQVIEWSRLSERKGSTGLLRILLGEDDYSIRQELDEIRRELGDAVMLETNTVKLEGHSLTAEEMRSVCLAIPFLAEKRLVIISGLLERFENNRGGARKKRKKAESGPAAEHEVFAGIIQQLPESTVVVLVDNKAKSSNPLLAAVSGCGKVTQFPRLRGERLKQWIRQRVTEEGGSISSEAVENLAGMIGGDLWQMSNEINKLVIYAAGRRIELADVSLVTSHSQEANIFAMLDAVFEFKAGTAEQLLFKLLQNGAAPAYLMTMLARQVQLVIRAREMLSRRVSDGEIQRRLGLAEFAMRRTLAQANRYSARRLSIMYHKLLEADMAIKTGRSDAEMALTLLVAEMCQR